MATTERWDQTRDDRKRPANVSRKKAAAQKLARAQAQKGKQRKDDRIRMQSGNSGDGSANDV